MSYELNCLQKFPEDPYLGDFLGHIKYRKDNVESLEKKLTNNISLAEFSSAHEFFGFHFKNNQWTLREWAPNATKIVLVGDFNNWTESQEYELNRISDSGNWELILPAEKLNHQDLYKLKISFDGGCEDRIPAYARRVVQDNETKSFSGQIWVPEDSYQWENRLSIPVENPIIYEAHVGMALEREGVGTYLEFKENILPRLVKSNYNTIQLMAIMEHPYYGSFGYHVSNFFAASSRFGTPEELKELIDAIHGEGLAVIIDLVHSHSVNNELEGLSKFDGTYYQYFHDGDRGQHEAWNSRCFNYEKTEVLHFLLSNCRYWLDEFKVDGFRFDGITSMLYFDHGLGTAFGGYHDYFDTSRVDEDAVSYLTLANKLIHQINPNAITIAEDVSGMPGLGASVENGGIGFDYKLAMGVPDFWFDYLKDVQDEDWNMDGIWYNLTNRRADEKSISYVECHDQSIVGGKTSIFELIDAEMYTGMDIKSNNIIVERGIALHKILRLITLATCGDGYLNFIGNEFGHPEWVDFPREGNDWSYKFARRQWSLRDDDNLKYKFLADFDQEMLRIIEENKTLKYKTKLLYTHCENQLLAFQRGNLIFIFNFNPDTSFSDYFLDIPEGEEFSLILNSDSKEFGGYERVKIGEIYKIENWDSRKGIKVYIPNRSVFVLKIN